ncbi:MAG TPA: branched-chain amino acid ABC transporter permease, partial [Candidatus Methylomirabilis sp.]|nr:branched-chain amino acid ABC transporter permease [Candidatus Methylomirabilis sp.]
CCLLPAACFPIRCSVLEAAIGGLITGSFYALVASGFALIFGVTRVFNLAHGDLVILGAYTGEVLFRQAGWSPILAMPLAALPAMLLAMGYRPLLARLGEPFALRAVVLTFGISLVLQSGLQSLFTADFRLIVVPEWDRGIRLLGARVPAGRLFVAATALFLLVSLYLLFNRTFFGKSLRAVSLDREAAALAGINAAKVDQITLALGGALAGAAGPLFAAIHYVNPSAGMGPTLTAIVLTIFSGVGSMGGLLAGGLLLGVVEAMTAWVAGAMWRDLMTLAMLLVLLRWRGRVA